MPATSRAASSGAKSPPRSLASNPVVDGIQLDGLVAGDQEEAKSTVLQLVQSLGFRPIDAGPLTKARALEGMSLLNIQLQVRNGWPWRTAWKLLGPTGWPDGRRLLE